MYELLEVVADAVITEAGGMASIHVGSYPPDDDSSVYVVVPHEYFAVTPEIHRASPAQMRRTIAFCVEHPGNATFETTAQWAARLGAVMDINRDSTAELCRRGIQTWRFQLGYSPLWDAWGGDAGARRGVDITYMGTTDLRRDRLLAIQARRLSEWRTALFIPPHELMTRGRPDFLMGATKYQHLANSRILLNLHRGASRALEWVRVLEAMCNGCVVVSEHSVDVEPLVGGTHVAFARPESVAAVATALLRHPERLEEMRDQAYAYCRDALSMHDSATRLLEIADSVLRGKPARARRLRPQHPASDAMPSMPEPAQPDPETPSLNPWTIGLPASTRAAVAAVLADVLHRTDVTISECRPAPSQAPTQLDVIIAGSGNDAALGTTLRSLAIQDIATRVLIGTAVTASPDLGYPRARVRNVLLERSRADVVLIVDPGHEFFPGALKKLLDALSAHPETSAVYPIMADLHSGRLWNALPVEDERLKRRVYLGAPLLIRREALLAVGGYCEDPTVGGFEDHELWLRLIAQGHAGKLVPEILGTGCRPEPPPFGIASLVPNQARAAMTAGNVSPAPNR